MTLSNKLEVLAPAGNFDSLRAAVVNGADAVYLGASAFSARAKAGNFSEEELVSAVEYCHLYGVRVYLAINTVIKRTEYDEALKTVLMAKNAGVDAFIVQDLAFFEYLHGTTPDIIVHFSTQAGIHNLDGARVAEKLGATRVILSREVLPEDIKAIRDNTSLEIECFVHGALCVSFSGNCYFSSLVSGLSGNRGKCLQLCRKKYELGGKKAYWLSAKDMDLSSKIDELIAAGVTSFKIEGRMRRPEYVGEAVRHYKALVSRERSSGGTLRKLFNRGDGCVGYLENPTENVIYPKTQGHIGVNIGRVSTLRGKRAVLELKKPLSVGDGVKFLRNGEETASALIAEHGNETTFVGHVKVGDSVSITTDTNLIKEISSRTRKLPVSVALYVCEGEALSAKLSCSGASFELSSDFCTQSALNAPLACDDFRKCFAKTDAMEFELAEFGCNVNGKVFVSKGELNSFRRSCYAGLREKLLRDYDKLKQTNDLFKQADFSAIKPPCNHVYKINTIIQTDDLGALHDYADLCDAVAYFPKHYDDRVVDDIKNCSQKVYLVIPPIVRGGDRKVLERILQNDCIKSVIINNIAGFELCKDKEILIGTGLNVINSDFDAPKILSPEYDGRNYGDNFVYVYGKFPLMTFAHCPRKSINGGKCQKCGQENDIITDEQGNEFLLRFFKLKYCYCQLLNSLPIDIVSSGKIAARKKFIDLVGYSNEEKAMILKKMNCGERLSDNRTNGYFNKILN